MVRCEITLFVGKRQCGQIARNGALWLGRHDDMWNDFIHEIGKVWDDFTDGIGEMWVTVLVEMRCGMILLTKTEGLYTDG